MPVEIHWWNYDESEGIGPSQQPICATPLCNKPTETRGLCNTCFRAWLRDGDRGLKRREIRCSGIHVGIPKIPINVDEALRLLVDVYEKEYIVAETDEEHDKAKRRLIKICDSIGNVERRRRLRKNRDEYKLSFIEKFGLQAWRDKQAAAQRQCRGRRKLRTGKDR